MSNYPGNMKNNFETPEGQPQYPKPTAPPLSVQPQQNPRIVYIPNISQNLTMLQFKPNYSHNPHLYAPRRQEFIYIPQKKQHKPKKTNSFLKAFAACFCCLFCCCPIPC